MQTRESHQVIYGPIEHYRIRIQQEKKLPLRIQRCPIVSCGESQVFCAAYKNNPATKLGGNHVRRTISGRIIQNNQFELGLLGFLENGA
jgi:hypothetical protein